MAAWLPLLLRRLPLSLPIVCVALGAVIFTVPWLSWEPRPIDYPVATERLTEFVVIIALMGAGLKIDRIFNWQRWAVTWRLLAITMPVSIAAITLVGIWAGLPWSAALLLGASLAPTDPVLASDVQVGPPRTGDEDEVRFGLTSEAGLNDGLAFPFVHLAIVLSVASNAGEPWFLEWLTFSVAWKVGVGLLAGWLIGLVFGWLAFQLPAESQMSRTGDGLIAIAATFVAYGLAETAHSYGFLAVFVAALTLRHSHRDHVFQREMHDLAEQVERLAMVVLLIFFGGALVSGLLSHLQFIDVAIAAAVLLAIRPLAGMIGLAGMNVTRSEKLILSFFGIRGVGSFYYLAYATNHATFPAAERLWAIVGLIVLVSILMHGLTVTPVMRGLDRRHGRDPDA
jgi:sodium/hydrogen antiporter